MPGFFFASAFRSAICADNPETRRTRTVTDKNLDRVQSPSPDDVPGRNPRSVNPAGTAPGQWRRGDGNDLKQLVFRLRFLVGCDRGSTPQCAVGGFASARGCTRKFSIRVHRRSFAVPNSYFTPIEDRPLTAKPAEIPSAIVLVAILRSWFWWPIHAVDRGRCPAIGHWFLVSCPCVRRMMRRTQGAGD
jgi:hypothetical protein